MIPGLAFGVVSSMAFATVAGAAGLDNYPTDPAEASSSIIDTSIVGQELAGAGHAEAGYPTNQGPNNKGLELDLLGSELIDLGGVQLPVTDFIDFGQMGALQSQSTASGPRDANSVTGLVGADGSITLDGTDTEFGAATIDLRSVFEKAGLTGLTDLAIDRADLTLGAGGAHVQAIDGVFQDPDGNGTGLGQYRAGEATLVLHSQTVDDLSATLYNSIGEIDTTMEQQVNQLLASTGALTSITNALPVGATLNATVESNMQEQIFQAILAQKITSKNEVLSIDFSTGTIEIHLDKAFSNELRPGILDGINNQPPNTELVDSQLYPIVAGTIHDLIEEVAARATNAVAGALGSVTLHLQAGLNTPAGGATVKWDVNLMGTQIAAPTCTPSGIGGPLACTTLMTAVGLLTPVINTALVPVRDFLLSPDGNQLFTLAITNIKTNAMTVPIRAILQPFLELLAQVVSLQINHQVQGTCTAADGSTHVNSLEVSAISLGLLQGVGPDGGARLNFGHAGARVDACNLVITPTLQASSPVPAGQSSDITSGGWKPNSPVSIQLVDPAGNPVGAPVPVTTDAQGNVPAGTTVPVPANAAPGAYKVVGTDPDNNRAESPLAVYSPALQAESPKKPGECSAITSGGWQPNSQVTLQLTDSAGSPIGAPVTVTTDANGNVPAGTCVTIPAGSTPGDYTVVGTDPNGANVTAPLTVSPAAIAPTLQASSPVPAGGSSDLTSGGWKPNSPVSFQLTDPSGAPVGTPVQVTTDAQGNIPAGTKLPVPANAAPGADKVVGTDADGNKAEAPLAVYAPTLQAASPTKPGECSAITSGGWQPNSQVTLQLTDANGAPVGQPVTVTTDAQGNVPANTCVTVPAGTPLGDYTVVGTDPNGANVKAPLTVSDQAIAPTLQATSPVPAGGSSDLTSGGWAPNSPVSFQLTDPAGQPVGTPVQVTTDANGNIPAGTTLPVPANAAPGSDKVVGTDANGNRAEAPLVVYSPTLQAASPTPVGECSAITSGGWQPNSQVALQLTDANGAPVGQPVVVTTDANGNVPAGTCVTVPVGTTPGDHTVVGTDGNGANVQAPLVVSEQAITPTLQASSPVPAGRSSELTSGGWKPNSPVSFQLVNAAGNDIGAPVQVTTDAQGAIPAGTQLPVPANAVGGDYKVVGTDPQGITAEAPISVYSPSITATSPAPAGGTTTVTSPGWLPNSSVVLDLTDAGGASLVTMQVTTDAQGDVPADTKLPVPAGTAPGAYTVVGTDVNGVKVSAPVEVVEQVITPTLQASSPVAAGHPSDIASNGWKPLSPVSIQLVDPAGQPVGAPVQVTADANGVIPSGTQLPVPANAAAGDYKAVGTDPQGNKAEAPVAVYSPSITATSPVQAGGETTVGSAGWLPNSQVTLQLRDGNGAPVGDPVTVTTNATGDIPAGTTLPVPAGTVPGAHQVTGIDANGVEVKAPVEVVAQTITPTLQASSPVPAGGSSDLTSGGWKPNSPVSFQLVDPAGNPVGAPVQVTTDANGAIPAGTTLPVPANAAPGSDKVVGTDADNNRVEAPVVVYAPTLQAASPTKPGECSAITSGGWQPNSQVTLQLTDANGAPTGQAVVVTTDANGNVPAGTCVTVPADAPLGDYTVVGTDPNGANVQAPLTVSDQAIAPSISVTSPVAAGSSTTVVSGGWAPNAPVSFQLVNAVGTPVGAPVQVTTDANGNAPVGTTVPVPAGEPAGDHKVVATDAQGNSVEDALLVYTPVLQAQNPTAVGQCSAITSGGWQPNSQVTLQLTDAQGNPVGAPVIATADAAGNLPADTCVTIPEGTAPGDHTIVGTDGNGGKAEAPVSVYAPSISATSPVSAGGATEVTSGGWLANSQVTLQLTDANGAPAGAPVVVTTDANGDVPAGTTLPVAADAVPGAYLVAGTDANGATVKAPIQVLAASASPTITATSPVQAGHTTAITSGGWAANAEVSIQLVNPAGGPVGAPVVVTADAQGALPAGTTVPVPAGAASGAYRVIATATASGATASAPVTVYAPSIAATSPVTAGGATEITSGGWLANSQVVLHLQDAQGNVLGTAVTVTTDANGNVPAATTIAVPATAAPGAYTAVGTDERGATVSAPVEVVAVGTAPVVQATSPIPAGHSTTITSSGWLANTAVSFQLVDANGNPVGAPVAVTTDANGAVAAGTTLAVPANAAAGTYRVVGTETGGRQASAPVAVYAPSISADSPVPAGTSSAVASGGWLPNTTVALQLTDANGNPVGVSMDVTTDGTGRIPAGVTVRIPATTTPGVYGLTGTDANGATASTQIQVTAAVGAVCADPKVTVSPNRAKAGESVTVTGTGFAAGSTATVQLYDKNGNALLNPALQVKVGNECGFSVKLTVPGSAQPGDHTVTVTDGDGNKASAKLTVGDFLAVTGADLGLYIPVGLLLLLAGAGAYVVHRRKQLHG